MIGTESSVEDPLVKVWQDDGWASADVNIEVKRIIQSPKGVELRPSSWYEVLLLTVREIVLIDSALHGYIEIITLFCKLLYLYRLSLNLNVVCNNKYIW